MKAIFLLYEEGQVPLLKKYLFTNEKTGNDLIVVALGLDIETKLREQGIPFVSGRPYKYASPDQLAEEDRILSVFFSHVGWREFTYRGVDLTQVFQFMFRAYIQRVWYFSHLLISLTEAHDRATELLLFAPQGGFVPDVSGILAGKEIQVVVDCARTIAEARGIRFTLLPIERRGQRNPKLYMLKRTLFGALLAIWNTAVTLVRPQSRPRIVVSDYWRHIEPIVREMESGEYIFLDRTEIRHIPWRLLLKHRMRFLHAEQFSTRSGRNQARLSAHLLRQKWETLRTQLPQAFLWRGYTFDVLAVEAVDIFASHFEKLLFEIENTYALYEHLKPDLVLLRASVSVQTHFSILPLVGGQCGIPSVELQHGLEHLGPGSWSREHVAHLLAVYGPIISKELRALGYPESRIEEVGSPRFDRYRARSTPDSSKKVVLCIAPDIRPYAIYDTYAVEDYFRSVAEAASHIPGIRIIIKLRAGKAGETFTRNIISRVFEHIPHTIAQQEPLHDLFRQATVVISGFSTAVLESMQWGLPVVIPAFSPIDAVVTDFHFAPYARAGALSVPHTAQEFSTTLSNLTLQNEAQIQMQRMAHQFLKKEYLFDGKSAERCAALIMRLTSASRRTPL